MKYGFVIDQDVCIGCHACTVACKTEHEVPLGVNRTWVKYIEKGSWPDTKRFFSVLRCNQCTDAPCVAICPTQALYKRHDGIVDFDTSRCIGCKSCMQGCPYDALYIDPTEHTAQKCNYCAHRTDVGLEPACAIVCPEEAIIAGDLDDPLSKISRMVATEKLTVRAPEQGTGPNVFYKGADSASLDPAQSGSLDDSGVWRDAPATSGSWLSVDLTPPGPGEIGESGRRHWLAIATSDDLEWQRFAAAGGLQQRPPHALGLEGVQLLPHQGDRSRNLGGRSRCPDCRSVNRIGVDDLGGASACWPVPPADRSPSRLGSKETRSLLLHLDEVEPDFLAGSRSVDTRCTGLPHGGLVPYWRVGTGWFGAGHLAISCERPWCGRPVTQPSCSAKPRGATSGRPLFSSGT